MTDTITRRPGTLGLFGFSERHAAARRRALEGIVRQWLDAINLRADPHTIETLAKQVKEARRA